METNILRAEADKATENNKRAKEENVTKQVNKLYEAMLPYAKKGLYSAMYQSHFLSLEAIKRLSDAGVVIKDKSDDVSNLYEVKW